MISPGELATQFRELHGSSPQIYRAPGRVNLIGEHTDYNAGLVMPAAIQFETRVAIAPRNDRKLTMRSLNINADFAVDLPVKFQRTPPPRPTGSWSDYVVGVAWALGRAGLPVSGADLLIHGTVPIGSGLSSSAALEVAAGYALIEIAGGTPDLLQLAELCQRAENEYVGTRCGLMDQFAAAFGRAGHALYFDCRSHEYAPIRLGEAALVVCNSMVKHQLASGEYNRRRQECEAGVRTLASRRPDILSLRDVSPAELLQAENALDPVVFRRCRHVLSENTRVVAMRAALAAGQLAAAGKLMRESHASLRDDYAVSCDELDLLVVLAERVDGVYGARMTGGGFGGCTVNLVRYDAVEEFTQFVSTEYAQSTGHRPETHVCQAADGAGRIV
jgi:galactokinase